MLQSITSYLNNATHLNQAQIFVVCEFKRNIIKRKEHSLDCSKCRDKSYSIVEIKKFIQEEPSLEQSRIRFIDLGIQIKIDQQYNYFRHINPRKKKTILQILDAYIDNLAQEETKLLQDALSIYFDNTYQGKEMENLICGEKDQPEPLLCHIYSFMIFDRLSSHYARYEYLDQFKIIEYFNQRDKNVFTFHPTQPNSLTELITKSRMLQRIEQNDYKYLNYAVKLFIQSKKQRIFKENYPSYYYIEYFLY